MLELYDGLWLLGSGQLSDSAEVYSAKCQMVQSSLIGKHSLQGTVIKGVI